MSTVVVTVPELSESVSDATMLAWKKSVGDAVAAEEILTGVETDKVTMDIPSPAGGVLVEILAQEGDTVFGGQTIARIEPGAVAEVSAPVAAANGTQHLAQQPAQHLAPNHAPNLTPSRASAMPAAAKLMADHQLAPGAVAGTGKDGRITKGDVLRAVEARGAESAAPSSPVSFLPRGKDSAAAREAALANRPEQRVPMSRLRARVAERLLQSQATNAILTTFNEVNMGPMLEMRKRMQEAFEKEHGVRLGLMSFFVMAVVHALRKFPILNASVDGTDIVYHGYFDIGIAIGSPRGLVVPILRNADKLGFAEIEKKIVDFTQKARDGKLEMEDLAGGTFTISNGGTFGSMMSTPIINPPQSAILGVHATKDRAVVENGHIVVRPMNYFALSYDHRIIDGREAVLGLAAIKESLEDPARLLFDI
ncbi:2-oxoglutarate dehydrogenase complex dihydrolipoyllysine-residue succinyltransferase [Candidatus Symbiobacter mobilis]|uniref:Dihydrolipoyllysine-residue succinyltransferase component of 2-oxoglutarate dehydrogenase complex n=1 Tax=Candidatus Symbiobacter mobilis CR TaxID=946483 RepID=U5N4M4_9BURK|nr:2-oxoglutarate dehydrogenase complex dihydrolipoyllysine-residue succinyltransferase [Candidatus Symbiobacter mobilis]AGX86426.1 2-oxoglutarate dehydrogenase E2 component [Candidatus Symbiobacter mobilis CR]